MAEAIPYQVIGGQKFYERAEIRDALAYFRVVLQPHDDLALERIINKPARGVGAKALEKLRETARSNGISFIWPQKNGSGRHTYRQSQNRAGRPDR